jgi:hypothetical protein
MTEEERARILAEARENVRLRDFPNATNVHADPPPQRVSEELRREWKRPEPEPKKRERGLDTAPAVEPDWSGWEAWADAKINNAIQEERTFLIETIGQALGEMLEKEREEHRKALRLEVAEMRLELVKLRTVLAEYRAFSADGGRSVLDLPNPLSLRTRTN